MEITFKSKRYNLSQNNFVAAGGEGTVYRYDDFAFKVFHTGVSLPEKKKIEMLEPMRRPEINLTLGQIRPEGLAYNWIDGRPLAECVTNDFWKTFSYDRAEKVVIASREVVADAHSNGFSLVDLNGANLMLKDGSPVFIDVESWSAKGFEADYATAKISPAIRDWREKKIGVGADWFAWAIIMFEFYVGIHPFRAGTVDGYGKKEWQKRMEDGKSVFVAASGMSPNCRSIDAIPENLRAWMERVFAGNRNAPPEVKGLPGYIVKKQPVRSHDNFELILLQEYDSDILYHIFIGNQRIVKTKNHIWVNRVDHRSDIATIIEGDTILIRQDGDKLTLSNIQATVPCEKSNWGIWQGKIFSKIKGNFYWYKIGKLGSGLYVAPEKTISVYENATKVFNGFCIVDAEGRKNLVAESVYRFQELDEYKVISGRRLSHDTFIVVAEKNSELTEFTAKIYGNTLVVRMREVDQATIMAASPRKDFIVQLDGTEVRLTSGNQVQTFAGTFTVDFISSEDDNTVIAIGNQLFRLKTK